MNRLVPPPRRFLKNLLHDRAGAAAVTIAISLTGIAGLAGLGTEAANWYLTARALQGAADASAHTGATALMNKATTAAATTQACSVAKSFGFTCTASNVHIPPTSGSHAGSTDAVEVDLSQAQNLMLSGLFMSAAPTIAARSVAVAATSGANAYPPIVMTLDTNNETSLTVGGSSSLNLVGGSVYVNSGGTGALTMSGGTITAPAAYVVGTVSGSGLSTSTQTGGPKTGADPHLDPYISASVPSYTGVTNANGTGCNQKNYHPNNSATLNASGTTPYVFCNGIKIDAGGTTLTLGAGTYIIDQGSLSLTNGGALVATAGTTIILTNDTGGNPATASISGGTLTLTAPTSGSLKGIALFQDRVTCTGPSSQCMNNLTGGSNQNITGAIYFPNNAVTYNGGAATGGAVCTQLIAYQITFQGNPTLNSTCSSAGTATIYVTASQLAE